MNSALSKAAESQQMKANIKTPIGMREMLQTTSISYNLDYMFVDMGSAGSSGNFGIFYACDGFIVPTNADQFSKMSISSISLILKR